MSNSIVMEFADHGDLF